MSDFPECDQFNAHRRRICRGERTDLSRTMINRYRTAWGLAPLPGDEPPPNVPGAASGPSPPQAAPSLAKRVVTFATALKAHVRDGMSKCDDGEIQARLQICQQCPSFTGTHCRECGCACHANNTFFNKLAWRSEKCPLGRW